MIRAAKPKHRKNMIKRLLIAFFAVSMLVAGATGCKTAEGAGEDIENLGEKIQEKTE
jgi:predicted small secreted protein